MTAGLRRVVLNATSGLATSSETTFRCRVSTCRTVGLVDVSSHTDSSFAAWCLALIRSSGNANTAWSTVGNGNVISHTYARFATRCAAVSGDIWS